MKHEFDDPRGGMALLVVVVLTMLIALAAYRFSFYMESQYRLTRLHEEQVHAQLAAMSGLELAASLAELPATERASLGGLLNNPALLRHVAIEAQPELASAGGSDEFTWRCGLVSPGDAGASTHHSDSTVATPDSANNAIDNLTSVRFGLENESAKLNMPALLEWDRRQPGHARATLLRLPEATEPLVDAWLQGLGVASRANNSLAGSSSLLERLQSSNGSDTSPSSTDPLKLLWYGGDLNQNYQLDPLELRLAARLTSLSKTSSQPSFASPNASSLGSSSPAWQRYITWHSGQRNETTSGQPRINLNGSNLQALHQQLSSAWPSDWANFVIAMRQYGPSGTSRPGAGAAASTSGETYAPDFSTPSSYTFKSLLDLIGATVEIPVTSATSSTDDQSKSKQPTKRTLTSPFSSDLSETRNYLGRVLDEATVEPSPFTSGRIDVSAAPAEVLAGVPGIDVALAQRIVQLRDTNLGSASTGETQNTIAWLLDGGTMDLVKLKQLEPYLTSRNDVYAVQSVGYRDPLSPVYRCSATIDARQIPARIVHLQNWHPWDRGFTMDQLHSPDQ